MKKTLLALLGVFVMGMAMAQNHWSPISGTQYNMTVKGVIVIDGVQQSNTMLEIGAFCGEECRGSRKATLFPPTGDYIVTLTIVSNVASGETITFRIYDHDAQQELTLESLSTLTFVDNSNAGNPTGWFPIEFATPVIHNTTSGDWNDPDTWGGTLPGEDAVVELVGEVAIGESAPATVTVAGLTIPDGATLTIRSGSTLVVTGNLVSGNEAGLVIEDGAQLVNSSANVKATGKKNIVSYMAKENAGWYAISSMVSNMTIAGSDFVIPEYDLYRYDEANHEWENYKAGEFMTFENGRGYLYANTSTPAPEFVGTLNNAAVTAPVTFTASAGDLKGFNLIGNPFPHVIYKGAGGAIDNANLASGYYTLNNEGAWHVHTYEDGIMPGQGILVKTTAAANLNIAKSTTAATAESSGAKSTAGRIGINLTGNNHEDRAFVYFSEGIGLNKMNSLSDVPGIWIRFKGEDFAIAHLDEACESVDLFLDNSQEGDFNLSFKVKDTSFSYLRLIDNVTGGVVDLLQQDEYGFHATGNESAARFKLEFKVSTDVAETATETLFAYVSDGRIVLLDVEDSARVQVMDMTGRLLVSRDGACTVSTDGMAPGIYVLRLVNKNNVKSQKIVIP